MARWSRGSVLLGAAAGGLAAVVLAVALTRPDGSSAIAQAAASPGVSSNPDDFVKVVNHKLTLHGRPFIAKGTNYFGSWRFPMTLRLNDGVQHATIWSFFHHWDAHKLDLDFKFLKAQLNATALRVGTPALADFEPLVKYHGYEPWFTADGSIIEGYKRKLAELADTAYADGLRIELCLLWNVSGEIAKDPEAFKPGQRLDRFYSNQVRSIGAALRDHQGVMAYSVGNEVLVNWPINGNHRSWYEGVAGAFMVRRLQELRAVAPLQLRTADEVAHPLTHGWYEPGPEFAALTEDAGKEGRPFRLVYAIDYLGPHFYPEVVTADDVPDDRFAPKLADAQRRLDDYMKAANEAGKPVVIDEFGLKLRPPTLDRDAYAGPRDRLFRSFIAAAERDGVQGLLAWLALPDLVLRPGDYSIMPSALNHYSPIEVYIRSSGRRVLFYDPSFDLFSWRDPSPVPAPTPAADAIRRAWSGASHA